MDIIRKVEEFELLYEPLQRMYRVTDGYDVSFWFNDHTKDYLKSISSFKFKKECERMILNSLIIS